MMKGQRYIRTRAGVEYVVLIGASVAYVALALLPLLARLYREMPLFHGAESYFSLSAFRGVLDAPWSLYGYLAGVDVLVLLMVNFLLGLASILLFWSALRCSGAASSVRWISLAILVFCPPFIAAASRIGPAMMVVFFSLVAVRLWQERPWFAVVPMLMVAVFMPLAGLVLAAFLASVSRSRWWLVFSVIGMVCAGWVLFAGVQSGRWFAQYGIIADVGASLGVSVFVVLAGIIGTVALWARLGRALRFFVLGAIVLVIVDASALLILLPGFAAVAGVGMVALMRRRWAFGALRDAAVLLMACGVLFTAVSFAASAARGHPTTNLRDALESVRDFPEGVVLIRPSLDPYAAFFTGKQVGFDMFASGDESAFNRLMAATRYADARAELDAFPQQYQYIVLDDSVLDRDRRGLPFLVVNNERFINVTTNQDVEVWLHIRP